VIDGIDFISNGTVVVQIILEVPTPKELFAQFVRKLRGCFDFCGQPNVERWMQKVCTVTQGNVRELKGCAVSLEDYLINGGINLWGCILHYKNERNLSWYDMKVKYQKVGQALIMRKWKAEIFRSILNRNIIELLQTFYWM